MMENRFMLLFLCIHPSRSDPARLVDLGLTPQQLHLKCLEVLDQILRFRGRR